MLLDLGQKAMQRRRLNVEGPRQARLFDHHHGEGGQVLLWGVSNTSQKHKQRRTDQAN